MVKVFSGICPTPEPQVDAIYHGCLHWFSIKKKYFPVNRKRKTRSVLCPSHPTKTRTFHPVSLPPKLPAWPLRYLRFHTLGLWPCRANSLRLSANTFFKQTTRGKHILSTQSPVLPKYAGFLTLPFLAGVSIGEGKGP